MIRIPLTEAQLYLPKLIATLQPGEEVQIFSGDRTITKLTAEISLSLNRRQPGSAIGTLTILSEQKIIKN